ncbi:MAG: porin family protein [Methylocystis sp.]|nr:porin family protein [Methylocystis sp.]MCA3583811.1 porin family protein [Methylocystis sp.]MCA3586484.1 porin family protein [Methylocystis sp.]MCA3589915.1 porin family protein [Methylocystis sp.]
MAGKGSSPVCVGDHSMRYSFALLGIVGIVGLSGPALSADPSSTPVLRGALPLAEPIFDWSGFYAGGAAAYAYGNLTRNRLRLGPSLTQIVAGSTVEQSILQLPLTTSGQNQNGSTAFGIFAGYNTAVDDMVVGIEADYYRSQITGTNSGFGSGQTVPQAVGPLTVFESWSATTSARVKITDYGSVRGRIGYAWGNLLPYLTAGVAVARMSFSDSATVDATFTEIDSSTVPATRTTGVVDFNPNSYTTRVGTSVQFGYALGAGIDWAVTSNIFLRAELSHMRFGNINGFDIAINSARVGGGLKF